MSLTLEVPETSPADIQTELNTMKKNLREIAKHVGKFVLIGGDKISGYFDTYAQADRAGFKERGLRSFLVKKITPQETPLSVMRCGSVKMDPNNLQIAKRK